MTIKPDRQTLSIVVSTTEPSMKTNSQPTDSESRLSTLRRLILSPEQEKLTRLEQRLDNESIRADETGQVLPQAIVTSSKNGDQLSDALMPTVEAAVKASVTRDISTFADALYPVMGPAIRRSISETFKDMLQSLNTTLENSFSWQGLQWRLEAMRTGQSFSEIVLLRSLLYRVEQVFLIHRETGCLLQHVTSIDSVQDADLVSGMLTAISDFVKDSFSVDGKSTLDSIEIDDLTVLIEPGPLAVIAIVVRGNPPKNLREDARNALESIHREQRQLLLDFNGDAQPFEQSQHYLEDCIQAQYIQKKKQPVFSPQIALLLVAIVIVVGGWMISTYKNQTNWDAYIDRLAQEPGIVITDVKQNAGHFSIRGLRDPLARTPQAIRDETVPISDSEISYLLEPYQSLTPAFIVQRAEKALDKPEKISLSYVDGVLKAQGMASYQWQMDARKLAKAVSGVREYDDSDVHNADLKLLNPPETVTLSLEKSILSASGSAAYEWIRKARHRVKAMSGISHYDDSQLANLDLMDLTVPTTVNMTLSDGVLTASGEANHQWIVYARQHAASMSGVELYDDSQLNDIELSQMLSIIKQLENTTILFELNSWEQATQQMEQQTVLKAIQQLFQLAEAVGKTIAIDVIGHSDSIGNYDYNYDLSQQRAEFIFNYLLNHGISKTSLRAQGVGSSLPVGNDPQGKDINLNRSVTFSVYTADF